MDTYRPTTAYRCAMYGCDKQGVQVAIVTFNGSVGFYGECEEHRTDPRAQHEKNVALALKMDREREARRLARSAER